MAGAGLAARGDGGQGMPLGSPADTPHVLPQAARTDTGLAEKNNICDDTLNPTLSALNTGAQCCSVV